jgi:hypothetical protein
MRLDLIQPLHPRLQAAYVQEQVPAAEPAGEPIVQELRLALGIIVTVVDKYAHLQWSHVRLPLLGIT